MGVGVGRGGKGVVSAGQVAAERARRQVRQGALEAQAAEEGARAVRGAQGLWEQQMRGWGAGWDPKKEGRERGFWRPRAQEAVWGRARSWRGTATTGRTLDTDREVNSEQEFKSNFKTTGVLAWVLEGLKSLQLKGLESRFGPGFRQA